MLRTLKKQTIAMAAALWLLHSVVPHVHHAIETGISSSGGSGHAGFWQKLFSPDLGDHHLEDLQVPAAGPILGLLGAGPHLPKLYFSQRRESTSKKLSFSWAEYLFTTSQRGPPANW